MPCNQVRGAFHEHTSCHRKMPGIFPKGSVATSRHVFGQQLTVQKLPDGCIQVMATKPSGQMSDAFDMLKSKTTTKLSIDEMSAVAAQGRAGKS